MTDSTTTTETDAAVNATVFGQVIPIMFGSAQILAAPLWASPPIQNADGSRIIDIAYMLGYRDPLTTSVKLLKVFLNSSLAYSSEDDTATAGAATAGNLSTFKFTFYDGGPDQLPDPTITAQEGVDNTPAFTYRMYIVIQGLYVPAGVTFPEISCEISQSININNTRYVTPIPKANGEFVTPNGPLFIDVPTGLMWCIDYGASPHQLARVFDINAQIERYEISIDAIVVLCTGRYTPYMFGKTGNGKLGVLDLYGNLYECPSTTAYGAVAEQAKVGPPLKDGTQYVFCHNLGENADVYRFNPAAFTLTKHYSMSIPGPFGEYGVVPQPLAMNIFSPNNDCGLAYFGAGRDISVAFSSLSAEAQIGTRTCVWTAGDGYPNGKTQIDILSSADFAGGFINFDVFFRDTLSETNWNTYQLKSIVTDPTQGKYVSLLFVNGIDGSMYWVKMATVYYYLGIQNPGHTTAGTVITPNPPPALPTLQTTQVLSYARFDASLGISCSNVGDYGIGQVADTETTISWPVAAGSNGMVSFDMSNGKYRLYVHGHFVNTLTGYDYGTSPAFNTNMVWNSTKRGFYYHYLGGGVANPGFCYLYAAPTNNATLLISSLLLSICLLAGFTADQIETTNCDDPIVGAIVNQSTSYLDLLTSICQLWCIDIVESGGLIKFTRRLLGANFNVDKVLTDDDLAPIDQSNADDGTVISKVRSATVTLPAQVQTTYLDSDNDFQLGNQNARRTIYPVKTIFTQNLNIETIGVPVAMNAMTALYWTELYLFTQWSQALQLMFRVSQAHMDLEPGDYVQINTLNDGDYTCKISEVDLNTDMSLSITAYTVLAIAPDNKNINPINVITGPVNKLPSAGQNGSFNYWVIDNFSPTQGVGNEVMAQLFCYASQALTVYLLNLDSTYSKAVILTPTIYGVLGTVLDNVKTWQLSTPDMATQLIVRNVTNGAPAVPVNDDAWRLGSCAIAVGSLGRWEYIYYRTATLNSDGSYTLTGLIRGQRGTDTVDNRKLGDNVLFVTQSSTSPISYVEHTGRSAQVIGTYSNRLPTDPIGKASYVNLSGGSVKELAPVNVQAARSGSDVILTWNRRSRIDAPNSFADGSPNDPPLDQSLERYDVDIISTGGAVLRTYAALTAPTVTYSSADQSSDSYTVGAQIRVVVYQTSPFLGRGYGRDELCQVN